MSIYWVMIEVTPSEDNEEKDLSSGAFLNCWVKADSKDEAIEATKDYADAQCWDFVSLEDCDEVTRENYLDDEDAQESLEAYDEASIEGISGIFYTWDEDQSDE